MCGIAGAVSASPLDPKVIEEARDRLAHRGPDHAGIWSSPDGRICLGHRRLAIIDLTPEANQPFLSSDGRFAINFNGEIYNYRALRDELGRLGIRFRTTSDTEVLVEAFRQWGERSLERLSGMFAFALWDGAERKLYCARDRVGEKPFYYATIGGTFVFASELKGIASWPGFERRLHQPALIDYLSLGFVADPKSIWEGCSKLEPGHWMAVSLPQEGPPVVGRPVPYWDLRFEPDHGVADWSDAIRHTLETAASEMAVSDVPLGTFLSGGVDSSSVTAALSRSGFKVNTYTIGFQEEGYDERPWARTVAKLYDTRHTERVVQAGDIEPVFEQLLWHYDEPFADYSYLPTFYLCREARKSITVALSGDGGDELFAGYLKYQRIGMRQGLDGLIPAPLGRLAAAAGERLLPDRSPLRRTLVQYGRDATAMMADMLTLGFPARSLRRVARGPLAVAAAEYAPIDVVAAHLRNAPPAELGLVNAMRYLDLKLTLAGDMLVKVDRASMAVSLEVRPVYLHRDLLSLSARIPPSLLAGPNHSKGVLKSALRAWLPDALLFRRKMGFAMPLSRWLDAVDLPGGPGPLDDLVDGKLMGELKAAQARGQGDQTPLMHSLFFLDRWLRKWA